MTALWLSAEKREVWLLIGLVLDALIIALFVGYILKNRKTTQLRCMLETCSYVVSIALAVPISIKLSQLSYSMFFRAAIANKLTKTVARIGEVQTQSDLFDLVMGDMPSMVQNAAGSYSTNSAQNIEQVERILDSGRNTSALEITDIIAQPVIEGVFRATFFLIFFVGLLFVCRAIAATLENILYTQDRASINTALSSVFGAFKAIVVLTVTVTVIQFVLPALPEIPFLTADSFNASFLFRLIYHHNVIMLFLGNGIYPSQLNSAAQTVVQTVALMA